jgi:hypothetical protein
MIANLAGRQTHPYTVSPSIVVVVWTGLILLPIQLWQDHHHNSGATSGTPLDPALL